MLVDPAKTRLLTQMAATGSVMMGVQSGLDFLAGFNFYASAELSGMLVMGLCYLICQRGHFLSASKIFLLSGHVVLFLFDDGFRQPACSWVLHIPLLAAAIVLFDGNLKRWRWFWLSVSIASVSLVNLTSLGPHWNTITAAGQERIVGLANLLVCLMGIWLTLHFMESRYLRELAARDQLEHKLHDALKKESKDSEAKSRLISHVSHEFRTPLNAISGFAQLLQQGNLSPSELAENLQAIHRSSDHLVHLVNDMLDLSRLEHGEFKLAKVAFDPEDKIRDCVSLMQHAAKEKGLRLEEIVEGDIRIVEGDPVRLSQVLLNLAGNAVKFTPTGTVTILLRQDPSPDEGTCVLHLEVSDTGPGIPESQRDFVFQRFTRLEESGPLGTGLGLAISRDLVERMSGRIDLQSRVGVGTTFTVEIPMRLSELQETAQMSDSWTRRPLAGKRILLCDDNRLNLRLASQVLKRMGVDFDLVESGEQALDFLSRSRYDLLMLDLHMPGIDGFEVARRLRTEPGPNQQTSILALTADASESTREKCIRMGMSGFAVKPIHLGQLELQLRRLLQDATT